MSSKNIQRIKQINQRNDQPFNSQHPFDTIPLGVDGLLVDMMSNLDLEEDLKIGNNHYVEINQINEYDTIITQYYFSQSRVIVNNGITTIRSIEQMQAANKVTHKVVINIAGTSSIKYLSFNGNEVAVGPLQQEINQYELDVLPNDTYILTEEMEQTINNTTLINMTLYQKAKQGQDYYQKIHQKSILITKNDFDNYIIDEQVDLISFEGGM